MTGDDGHELQPLFGPGLTGLRNLGNSCVMLTLVGLSAFQYLLNSLFSPICTPSPQMLPRLNHPNPILPPFLPSSLHRLQPLPHSHMHPPSRLVSRMSDAEDRGRTAERKVQREEGGRKPEWEVAGGTEAVWTEGFDREGT
jgi:hypothetical protein